MTAPRATIRLQFNRGFTLDDASEIVPYVADLGISHIYASPIMTAVPGSGHGYDVIKPDEINPEIGGIEALRRLTATLQRHRMGLVIDIVPNHMAADIRNPWWRDVLEWGPSSRYAAYFDIDWEDPDPVLQGKVLLPTLGDTLAACLGRGELRLDFDAETGGFVCRYYDRSFPISPRTYGDILHAAGEGDARERMALLQAFDAGHDEGRQRLRNLLERQNYVLVCWRDAAARINWRRFFDIDGLVALRMDRDAVFDAYHRRVLELFRDGWIDGVRVDHVDGLADPGAYCRRLREALARGTRHPYVIVEKILEGEEPLRRDWTVDGTTGYDFMDAVSAVLHDGNGAATLGEVWRRHTGETRGFSAIARDARREIVQSLFPKALETILRLLGEGEGGSAFPEESRRAALVALLAEGHRYRLYGDARGLDATDRLLLHGMRDTAAESCPALQPALFWLCERLEQATEARTRYQQLSATLTAKAVEDTAFYRYGRLLSRNEVGADPERLAISPRAFHALALRRQADFPRSMLATATHDHKRGEDNRARIAVLSEFPEEWAAFVDRWLRRQQSPDPAIVLMLYQTMIGAWPPALRPDDREGVAALRVRIETWLVKALREAKQTTSWNRPDEAYERRCIDLLGRMLDPEGAAEFLGALAAFVARLAPAGAVNSLTQTLLRLTTPGIPDLYQGTELWDFSLVDPDNRRAVDFPARRAALAAMDSLEALVPGWRDGRIKQGLIARVLAFRRQYPELFAEGDYEPLAAVGPASERVLAFLRRHAGLACLVVAPRLASRFVEGLPRVSAESWEDTRVDLPEDLRGIPGRHILRKGEAVPDVAGLLSTLPVALVFFDMR